METHSVVEHICLASDQEDSPQDRVVNTSFLQRSKWHCSEFTVFNDHYIAVESRGPGDRLRSCHFDLSVLSSQPKRLIRIDWVFMSVALAMCVAVALLEAAGATRHSGRLMATLFVAALAAFALALYRSSDRLVYYSKHGRAPLLVLRNGNPNRAALRGFVCDISERVRRTRQRWSDRHAFLSLELREHRRLYEQGLLSRTEYERAKKRILKRH